MGHRIRKILITVGLMAAVIGLPALMNNVYADETNVVHVSPNASFTKNLFQAMTFSSGFGMISGENSTNNTNKSQIFQGDGTAITKDMNQDIGRAYMLGHNQTTGMWVHLGSKGQHIAFVLSGASDGSSKSWGMVLDSSGSTPTTTSVYSGYLAPTTAGFTNADVTSNKSSVISANFSNTNEGDSPANYWKHVTLQWFAPPKGSTVGTMRYELDDENIDDNYTVTKKASFASQEVSIDTAKLGVSVTQLEGSTNGFVGDADDDSGVYWGISSQGAGTNYAFLESSTNYGSEGGNGLAVDAIGSKIEADASAEVDDSYGNTVKNNDTIINGQKLTYKYTANYDQDSSNIDWNGIIAKLNIPSGFKPTSAKVTYTDGSNPETIDLTQAINNGQLQYQLKRALNGNNPQATITIEGTANFDMTKDHDSSQTQTVDASKVSFTRNDDNSQGDVTASTNSFMVRLPQLTITPLTGEQNVSSDQNATIKFEVGTDADDVIPDASKMKLIGTLNGKSVALNAAIDQSLDGNAAKPTYTVTLANANADANVSSASYVTDNNKMIVPLGVGKNIAQNNNILTIQAVDSGNGEYIDSKSANYTIHVCGETTLNVNQDYDFGNLDLSGKSYITAGKNSGSKWQAIVKDTHVRTSEWTLTALQNGNFVDQNKKAMRGSLIYRSNDGQTDTSMLNNAVTISSGSQTTNQGVNATDGWGNNEGILMHINAGDTEGNYTGEIDWTLTDGPSATSSTK